MATFTTVSKNRLTWEAPPVTPVTGNEYVLEIGSDFQLLIGSGFKLVIQPGDIETVWTPVTKAQYS